MKISNFSKDTPSDMITVQLFDCENQTWLKAPAMFPYASNFHPQKKKKLKN